jgi:hypothetical protein
VRTAAAVLGSPPEAISGAIDPLDVTLTIFVSSEEIS